MGPKTISLIQIGDVHYPDLLSEPALGDVKDKGFESDRLNAIVSTKIAQISRVLQDLLRSDASIVAIALMGDLTTRGNAAGYEAAIKFLKSALALEDSSLWDDKVFLVVPGNHDLDRKSISLGSNPSDKFAALGELWKRGLPGRSAFHSTSPQVRKAALTSYPAASLDLIPINTCFLCGEHRAFPEQLRAEIQKLLQSYGTKIPSNDFDDILIEQVDCPAVELEHTNQVAQLIQDSSENSVPLVIGHHPLLPQSVVRVAGYTEMLNAGALREIIFSTRRSVVYLHGHVHQDPVHTISNTMIGDNRIISVSAPAITDGFNHISFVFSHTTDQPLGVKIAPYRFAQHLGLQKTGEHSLRLVNSDVLWNEVDDPVIAFVLERLGNPAQTIRFLELSNAYKEKLGASSANHEQAVTDALLVCEVLEVVQIQNRSKPRKHWQLRRCVL